MGAGFLSVEHGDPKERKCAAFSGAFPKIR